MKETSNLLALFTVGALFLTSLTLSLIWRLRGSNWIWKERPGKKLRHTAN